MIDFCVLGSGISGSTIANLLSKKYSVEIIDKANGIGGRASNKKLNKLVSFDHGLQYFSPKSINYQKYLNGFIKKGVLKFWGGNHIDLTFERKNNKKKIIGVKGNNDLNKYLLKKIKKTLNEEVINIKFTNNHWEIFGNKRKFKARSIIVTFPFDQTKKLVKKYLKGSFLKLKVKMTPNLTVLLSQKTKQSVPISSIKLNNSLVSWISNENSKKRFTKKESYWTIQTSEIFSKKNINLYKKKKNYYSNLIAKEFSNILNINFKSLKIFRIHGWKYSYNKIKTNDEFYWSKKLRIGVCGDWFIGPNAESSWMSANALFNAIKKNPPKSRRV